MSNIIKNVIIIEAGPAKGHYAYMSEDGKDMIYPASGPIPKGYIEASLCIGEESLEALLSLAKERDDSGVKCLLNHDRDVRNIIGCFKNFYRDGDKIRADLHLLENFEGSEKLIEISQKFPDEIGVSISSEFTASQVVSGKSCMIFTRLESCDLVTEAAATNGLLSMIKKIKLEEEEDPKKDLVEEQEAEMEDGGEVENLMDAITQAVENATAPLISRIEALEAKLSEDEEDDEEKEVEKNASLKKIVGSELKKVLLSLGVRSALSASPRQENHTLKMTFSEIAKSIQLSEGKTELEALKVAIERYPEKHQEHLNALKRK